MVNTVWHDLFRGDPEKIAQMEARSYIMMAINERIREEGWNVRQAAQRFGITEQQASALINGKLSKFGGQIDAIAAVGLLETFRVSSALDDPSESWAGRLTAGLADTPGGADEEARQ